MPDIAAARPVSGSPVEATWGTNIHDGLEGLQSGQVTVQITAADNGQLAVVFPRAYAAPPFVIVTINSSTALYFATANGITATGFNARACNRDSGASRTDTMVIGWWAIGTLATPG